MAKKTQWYKLPTTIKDTLSTLIDNVTTDTCFDTSTLEVLRDEVNWYNIPLLIDKVVANLIEVRYPVTIAKARWYKLSATVDELVLLVENYDCLSIPDIEAPSVPLNLASSSITATGVTLTWDAATDNYGVDHYNIYKDTVLETTRIGLTAVITGLTASTSYNFSVSALDAAGNESAQSAILNVTTTI